MKSRLSAIYTVIFLVMGITEATAKDFCIGTFSSMHFNTESGDLSGVEINIVNAHSGKQAAVQFSEGEPGALMVTPVVCDGTHLFFSLPRDAGRASATFSGVVSGKRLVGEFVFDTGARDKVSLVRRSSYWNKKHSR